MSAVRTRRPVRRRTRGAGAAPPARRRLPSTRLPSAPTLPTWLRAQSVNVTRHAAALRPFYRGEFGNAAASPSEGHVQAVNGLIVTLRRDLLRLAGQTSEAVRTATTNPTPARLRRVMASKEQAHDRVRAVERVWDFYLELFGQRMGEYADWLLSCDRIALDCYQVAFVGVGDAKSIPHPPPFSYMRTGFSPATFRRHIPLRALGRQLNPFPLVQLPYHRLVNPWTLGAVLHEVSHNLHNELNLHVVVPRAIASRLQAAGLPPSVVSTWVRWNRETFADLSGLLLGGPAVVGSLMDVVGRGPRTTVTYSGRGPHPTPYLRCFISIELLRRLGFRAEAERYRRVWSTLYPSARTGNIPRSMLDTFRRACPIVVDAVCFRRYPELGGKSLAESIQFRAKDQLMIEEAAGRLAAGVDPGVIPARFLIGAARHAFDRRLARPETITKNFYVELARR